jgi:hypothetical protein
MKTLFFSLALMVSVFSMAQQPVDSSKISETIKLRLDQMCYIKDCLGDNATPDFIIFYRQVARQVDTTTYNPAQEITFTGASQVILTCYMPVAMAPQGIAGTMNDEIKAALLPQIKNPWLISQITAIEARLRYAREMKISNGYRFFKSIK